MKYNSTWSRRGFLSTVGKAGAAVMLSPLAGWATEDTDPRIAAIVAATMGIDTHNHVDVPLTNGDVPGPHIDIADELKRSGLAAICMTFAVDYQKLGAGDGYARFLNGLDAMDQQLAQNSMKRALNLADLRAARKKHQPIVIQSVEGGHFLEGRAERVEEAYKRGLRHLGLLHDSDASVPLGDVYTNTAQFGGLTAFGKDVVKECNRLGILIDLAHANADTIAATLKRTTKPVIISHTGLNTRLGQNPGMAKRMMPRLISKEQAKIVADAGGVIGVWTHLSDTPLEYAENVRALVDVVGIDHVCIGTDTKLTTPYRPAGGNRPKPGGNDTANSHAGPPHDAPGGGGGKPPARVGERTNNAWKDETTGFYYAVVGALLKTGFSEQEIGKFGGGNFCRVFDAATAGHH